MLERKKPLKNRLTCKQIRGTYTYGRLLRWGQVMIFPGRSHGVFQIHGKKFISIFKQY